MDLNYKTWHVRFQVRKQGSIGAVHETAEYEVIAFSEQGAINKAVEQNVSAGYETHSVLSVQAEGEERRTFAATERQPWWMR